MGTQDQWRNETVKVGTLFVGGTEVTATAAEANLLDGASTANSTASVAAVLDSAKDLRSEGTGLGTAGTNCTVIHYGDGRNMTAVVTVTNAVMNPVGVSANLGVGYLVYTLPAGPCLITSARMSMALSGVTITNDTPDAGLGTVIASGAVTTLDGTATFENIITGQTMTDTNGTAVVKATAPTAGVPLEITTAGAHTVHFNMADGWGANTDASGLLNGTITLSFVRQG